LQLPALPEHCALAWFAPMAVANAIAANSERVAFISIDLRRNFDGADRRASWLKIGTLKCGWYFYQKDENGPPL
jgi:hypothetical protein